MSVDNVNSKNQKEINIEKFDLSDFSQEGSGFTQLSNIVIKNITDPFAFHIWAYLQSMPPTWIPNRQELINHFVIGEKKLTELLNFLIKSNLVITKQDRNSDGTMGKYRIRVLNGSRFIKLDSIKRRNNKEVDEQTTAPPLTAPPVNRPPAYGGYINKDNINKNTEIKNTTTEGSKLAEENSSSILLECDKNMKEEFCYRNELYNLDLSSSQVDELEELYARNMELLVLSAKRLRFDVRRNHRDKHTTAPLPQFFMSIMRQLKGYNAPKGWNDVEKVTRSVPGIFSASHKPYVRPPETITPMKVKAELSNLVAQLKGKYN